jgi:arabinogalactan endo-1,4-beta-galactosidase
LFQQYKISLKLDQLYRAALLTLVALAFLSCKKDSSPDWTPPEPPANELGFFTGMDMSYQSFLEEYNVQYLDKDGNPIDNLYGFLNNNGVNLIRVRLFHTPGQEDQLVYHSRLSEVKKLCLEIKASGNRIMLDIHYSDSWADPGKQYAPTVWNGLSLEVVKDSVYRYTKFVLDELSAQNTLPYMVQIGNETNPGFIWEYGRLGNNYSNMKNFVALINRAQEAIEDTRQETGEEIYSVVHYAGMNYSDYYFKQVIDAGASFDIMGLSYYHLWHTKDLDVVESTLTKLYNHNKKPVMIVETNYPFTLGWNDWTNNLVGEESQLIPGFPATPEGQKKYLEELVGIMKRIPDGFGAGVIWWAPDLVAFDGPESTSGSFMENLTTFDFDNRELPVMDVFRNN